MKRADRCDASGGIAVREKNTSPTLLPTTKAQVSGHRFLRRRVEHGLVFGDIRMIHDPLGTRSRALLFGFIATVLVGLGAGLMAWASPNPDPGEAAVVADDAGGLYVRVDDRLHPVANLASARLIAGEPADPASIGTEYLAASPHGSPVGIPDAPSLIAEQAPRRWSACWVAAAGEVVVRAGAEVTQLGEEAVFVPTHERDWVLTADGRRELPLADSPEGRVLRRGLGVDAGTPAVEVPGEVLGAVAEQPAWRLPDPLPHLLHTGSEAGTWALIDSAVAPLTEAQAGILADAGAPESEIDRAELADYPTHDGPAPSLPRLAPGWVDPAERAVCADESGAAATAPARLGGVELAGDAVADRFEGPAGGAFAVDTGHGLQMISGVGRRHDVPSPEALTALGAPEPADAPWEIVRLLPEGSVLSRELAARAMY